MNFGFEKFRRHPRRSEVIRIAPVHIVAMGGHHRCRPGLLVEVVSIPYGNGAFSRAGVEFLAIDTHKTKGRRNEKKKVKLK